MNRATRKILTLMLTIAVVFGMMAIIGPGTPTAWAAYSLDYGTLNNFYSPVWASGRPSEYQMVYFGANPFEDGSPNAWRVLKAGQDGLFLLSADMVKVIFDDSIDTEFYYGQWEERDWLNGDYQKNFTAAELRVARPQKILPDYGNKSEYQGSNEETVYDANGDLFFLLSQVEALNPQYFPAGIDDRICAYSWFLRSPGTHDVGCIDFVFTDGYVIHDGYANFIKDAGIRPACKLDTDSIFLISSAVGGKPENIGPMEQVQPTELMAEIKLTLLDEFLSPDFTAAPLALNGNTLTIQYSGAATGADKSVSAIITGAQGRVSYYGRMASGSQADGTLEINLPEDFNPSTHTVKVFAEQHSGDYKTDYASMPVTLHDITPPTVETIAPENGATGVETSGSIAITFSETIDTTGTVMLNNIELGKGTWKGNTYTISYSGLAYNTKYKVSITGFKDAAGIAMADSTANSFTTVSNIIADLIPPTVTKISPPNLAKDIKCSGNIAITFSEAIDITGTVSLNSTKLEVTGASWSGNTYSIPYSGLAYSTTYTVSITGFKDTAGIAMAGNNANSFTTVSSPGPVVGGGGGGGGSADAKLSKTEAAYDAAKGGDISLTITLNGKSLKNLKNGSYTLQGTDYTAGSSTITINGEYLSTLTAGTHTIVFEMNSGANPQLTITVTGSATIGEQPTPLGYLPMQPAHSEGALVAATKTNNALAVNGATTEFPAVKISGYNWLKLRDFAALLNGTSKQFSIFYDESTGIIDIRTSQAYQPLGDELADTLADMESAVASLQEIRLDGKPIDVAAYNIKGYNYLRLRDLAIILNFAVIYDDESGQITLDFAHPYQE